MADRWLSLHIGLVVCGLMGLSFSLLVAFSYLWQSHQIKTKHLDETFFHLPSLHLLDRIHFVSLTVSVVLFSLGLLSGAVWAQNIHEAKDAIKDPMVILSAVACLLYWLLLIARMSAMSQGTKVIMGTVLISVLLVIGVVSSYCPMSLHRGF